MHGELKKGRTLSIFRSAQRKREGDFSPSLTIPSFSTFPLGTCNKCSGWLYVPRIPIREKQLDPGRLTFFCHLLSAEPRQGLGVRQDKHTSEDTPGSVDKQIRANCLTEVTLGPWSDDDDGWWVLTKFQKEQTCGEVRDKELVIDARDRNLNIPVSLLQGHKDVQISIYQYQPCHESLKDSQNSQPFKNAQLWRLTC